MSSTRIAHLSFTFPTRVICCMIMLAWSIRDVIRLQTHLRDLVPSTLRISTMHLELGGGLTADYAPYYNHSVSMLIEKRWYDPCLLDQGEIQIKSISQARCSLGSTGVWRHDHGFAEFDVVPDPTEIAWLRKD